MVLTLSRCPAAAPLWPSMPWWPELWALRIARPVILPPAKHSPRVVSLKRLFRFPTHETSYVEDPDSHSKILA